MFRADGLELFDEMIRLGVYEAAAALELIDCRPVQRHRFRSLPRPRRRRRTRKDHD